MPRSLRLLLLVLLAVPALAPPAHAAALPGVQAHLLWAGVSGQEVDRQLRAARQVGSRIVRVDVGWSSLQPKGPGRWDAWHLGRLDRVVTRARAHDLQVLLTFWRSPCWASSAPARLRRGCRGAWWDRGVELYAPRRATHFGRALGTLARRYGTRVAGWEVWNEPNASSFFKARAPVRQYVGLLRAAHRELQAAAPSVPLVGGSLMYADDVWTRKAYAAGAKGHFDAWSIHPYSGDRSPLEGAPAPRWSFVQGVPAVRQVLLDHGDDKPVWLTEFGWQTSAVRGTREWLNGVDEATQAVFVQQALTQVAQWPWVHAAIVYGVKDRGTDPRQGIEHYGLFRADLRPKPAAAAFREAGEALLPLGGVLPVPLAG